MTVDEPVSDAVPAVRPQRWPRVYARRLAVTDAVVVAYALAGAHIVRFGVTAPDVSTSSRFQLDYLAVSLVIAVGWLVSLELLDSREVSVIGNGLEEYRRVLTASLRVFGLVAIAAYLAQLEIGRGYLAVALPVGVIGLVTSRFLWRRWLYSQRAFGRCDHRVLVVGSPGHVASLVHDLDRAPSSGFTVVGACLSGGPAAGAGPDVGTTVVGGLGDVVSALQMVGADTVAVTASDELPPETLRRLGWALEGTGVDLVVAPALTNIAGPRIHLRPVAGLPLLHVEEPRLPRGGQLVKDVFDRVGAASLLLALSPLLLVLAVVIRVTSPGPVFFRQLRIGRGGEVFDVWKLRTMVVDADARLAELLEQQGRADVPLFKVQDDPRITSVGRLLRAYSLDEVPQLLNVLTGQMSLVGPRPQRAEEVALYDDDARRRLLTKPGMTGLWQVSGRSDVPWPEAMRLDLYYVENWSFTFDLVLLWRTVFAVLRGRGAY